ncbi:MAG: hypothetical protein BGO70_04915 [Bacteroidetes bacterium 43-93]|nr:hypothetical protein [Bacteroidota bacterium]OJX00106.1 MAG: hypothetical protein BGO70_04915 [Bacteroidetes bacterium 43-93]
MRSLFLALIFCTTAASAQYKDSSIFKFPIKMDDVVIKAVRKGWDVNGFIRRVKNDTTFYKAFKGLHIATFNAINDIRVYDSKGKIKASLYSKTKQTYAGGCRTMQVLEEKTTGDFYTRRRRYNYYTAELYSFLFFTQGKKCGENDIVGSGIAREEGGKNESNSYKLKQLMFNPGGRVTGIPFMGDKSAIFDPSVEKMYDFRLTSDDYQGEECYVFKAIPKKEYADDVVYNEFTTWFRKSDYSIVARDYSLSYKTLVYDFDVRMRVRMTRANGKMLPGYLEYDGNWHVFTKGRERVKFTTQLSY